MVFVSVSCHPYPGALCGTDDEVLLFCVNRKLARGEVHEEVARTYGLIGRVCNISSSKPAYCHIK